MAHIQYLTQIHLDFGVVSMLPQACADAGITRPLVITDAGVRGRVMALYLMIFMGGTPIGGPLLGLIANELGARWAIGVGAVAGVIAAIVAIAWMRASRNLRIRRADLDARWYAPRFRIHYDGDERDRETATQEIAIVEAGSRRV